MSRQLARPIYGYDLERFHELDILKWEDEAPSA
jgi:hypothetical protein